jgi:hypothetical protein
VAAEATSAGLRSSLTLQVTLIVPGGALPVFSVVVASVPAMLPALAL